jgi:hypothetical protein
MTKPLLFWMRNVQRLPLCLRLSARPLPFPLPQIQQLLNGFPNEIRTLFIGVRVQNPVDPIQRPGNKTGVATMNVQRRDAILGIDLMRLGQRGFNLQRRRLSSRSMASRIRSARFSPS